MTLLSPHETVLRDEAVEAVVSDPDGIYVDGTFGRGGHSREILSRLSEQGRLIALDQDPSAASSGEALMRSDDRVEFLQAAFSSLADICLERGCHGQVSGLLLDLGVSSPQLDEAERGFSFLRDGPLDMRMNQASGISAAEWIRDAQEVDIADVLYRFGDEKYSRRMARAIVLARKESSIDTTLQLAEIVKQAHPAWEKDRHPATKAFQAIRIYINGELDELEGVLDQSLDVLRVGGRFSIISFHSLEDRIVKKFIAVQTKGDRFPRNLPVTDEMMNPRLRPLQKAVRPSAEEIAGNIRARSATLRSAEKIA